MPSYFYLMKIALLIFIVLSMILGIIVIELYINYTEIVNTFNEEIKSQNIGSENLKNLSREVNYKREELEEVRSEIEAQNNIVKSLTETAETLRQSAEDRAEKSYQARVAALELEYKKKNKELDSQLRLTLDKVKQEKEKLSGLEAKQLAYIKAQQRELEMEKKRDFYRLEIDDDDKGDIALLREMQKRFVRKEAIDKLIWEVYFKKPYDVLMSHLSFDSKSKICGIYKITDMIDGKVYIGQSTDIRERLRLHIKTALSSNQATNKLYQTMKKDGVENFTFELLEEVSRDKLNEREKYWIEFYKTREFGLNGTIGGS